MSVLNQSGEEQVECPLCMEPLEVDDLNFFPCTCGYQICRFCWHRIRTDENGLCPACRKAYSEDPADFTPLSQEQVAKLKAEKRQRDQQRKAKLSESRKHLASVRVVQRNLVFVVGLPMRLADPEVLKRHEYFGKFGKIHKVVINQSTSYAGTQGPSASAYVTYMKSDDALRAIQSVNNITIDGRLIKSSLGTTKYCSHFMKNQPCPKPDCMYLHDFDPEASFTKEQMHAGKHQEYEKKLHEALLSRAQQQQQLAQQQQQQQEQTTAKPTVKSKEGATHTNGSNDNKEKKGDKTKNKTKIKEGTKKEGKRSESKDSREESESGSSSSGSTSKLSILDDNSSFFSHNSFQKIVPDRRDDEEEEEGQGEATQSILTDSLPDINTSEDWAAAFGFPKLDSSIKVLEPPSPPTDPFFLPPSNHDNFRNLLDTKIQDNIMDALSNGKSSNGFTRPDHQSGYFKDQQGLDNMSKFFMDFHRNGQKDPYTNGYTQNHINGYQMQDKMFFQRKKLEAQLRNLSLNYPNGYVNGDVGQQQQQQHNGFGHYQNVMQGQPTQRQNSRTHSEDELDFDPFQETQKALEELIANERDYKAHSAVRNNVPTNQMNGVVHNQGGKGPMLPPPPGFVQPSTHMNSFGSKILPFLNMANNQQISPTQSWPSPSYSTQLPQHNKNLNTCNDWKEFDSAIVTTSRHYPLNMPPIRDHFTSLQLGTQQIPNGTLRGHDYNTQNNAFSNFTQQLQQQPNFNSFTTQPNLSWFTSELNSQISSPPGFRSTTQTTKQQEC